MPGACSVFTSNVDGQFQKAGFEEQQMHEHFSLQTMQRHHGHLLRINLREASVERESDTSIAAPAAAALQAIHEVWQASR
ncbi:hypothetical protein [Undibacterium oligocarboniphilum]|uniref:hypothetical protein n=1 Tax=Undibacterium oligocarboniphilum TaxID=666702 RepID=UPI00295BED7A|nr:hypothetical protein [Undibacterium oligocarboniphilum]